MAPRAISRIGGIVAKEVVQKVADNNFKKYPGHGRKLGSRNNGKKIEEGIKRVIEFGLETAEKAGGVKNLFKMAVAKSKRQGFLQVAEEVMQIASAGLVKLVNPLGFAAVFNPDGTCEVLFRDHAIDGPRDPRLRKDDLETSQANLPQNMVPKTEPTDSDIVKKSSKQLVKSTVKREPKVK